MILDFETGRRSTDQKFSDFQQGEKSVKNLTPQSEASYTRPETLGLNSISGTLTGKSQ